MPEQSARHIMMVEPADFYSNPETMETNTYQAENPADIDSIQKEAVKEFRALRDVLLENGVFITNMLGIKGSPDDVYCNNWVSTHDKDRMVFYPMLAPNRRLERRPEIVRMLKQSYDLVLDLSAEELNGRYLESTGSLGIDRVNGVIYSALSPRTDRGLAEKVAEIFGYDIEFFNTRNHVGKPVYHTDVLMFFGSGYIGMCTETIVPEDKDRVISRIKNTHDLIELSMDQMRSFAGNALELKGTDNQKLLAMSSGAQASLRPDQIAQIESHGVKIVHAPIPTIEKYGGGSVRCMLLELH